MVPVASFTGLVALALLATALAFPTAEVPTLSRRAVIAQCSLTPENAGDRICSLCRPLSPWAKTCTATEITSCTRARLVLTSTSGTTCVTSCPDLYFADAKNVACVASPTCSATSYLSDDKRTCVASPTCDANSYLSDDKRTCKSSPSCDGPATYLSDDKPSCATSPVCGATSYLSADKRSCIASPNCAFNEFLSLDKHSCGKCTTLDSRALSCTATVVKTCSTGRIGLGTKCVCPETSYESNGSCVPCSRVDSAAIKCDSRTAITVCKNGLISAGAKCKCADAASFRKGDVCIPCSTVDASALTCDGLTVTNCAPPFAPAGNSCKACLDSASAFDPAQGTCVACATKNPYATKCSFVSGQFNIDTCAFGLKAIAPALKTDSTCVCTDESQYISTEGTSPPTCETCPTNADCSTGVIECRLPFYFDESARVCKLSCAVDEWYDASQSVCVRCTSFHPAASRCDVGVVNLCKNGYAAQGDTCVCPGEDYPEDNFCSLCAIPDAFLTTDGCRDCADFNQLVDRCYNVVGLNADSGTNYNQMTPVRCIQGFKLNAQGDDCNCASVDMYKELITYESPHFTCLACPQNAVCDGSFDWSCAGGFELFYPDDPNTPWSCVPV